MYSLISATVVKTIIITPNLNSKNNLTLTNWTIREDDLALRTKLILYYTVVV